MKSWWLVIVNVNLTIRYVQQKWQICCHQTCFLSSSFFQNSFSGGAYNTPPDPLVSCGGDLSPYPFQSTSSASRSRHLRRLGCPATPMAVLANPECTLHRLTTSTFLLWSINVHCVLVELKMMRQFWCLRNKPLFVCFVIKGDSLSKQRGMMFTTRDRDHDKYVDSNCAVFAKGAWWYRYCSESNLNGEYFHGGDQTKKSNGIYWHGAKRSHLYSMKSVVMKISPYP